MIKVLVENLLDMIRFFIIFFIILILCSCHKYDKYTLFELSKNKPVSINSCKADTRRFDSIWQIINRNPKKYIEYLLTFEGKKGVYSKHGRLGFSDDRISYIHNSNITNDIAALHLICSIYYNNYFFSSDRILYSNHLIHYDTTTNMYYKTQNIEYKYSYIRYYYQSNKSTDEEVDLAWKLIKSWWKINKCNSIDEIRSGERPFSNSELYWYGEKGGLINKNFNQRFNPCYHRKDYPPAVSIPPLRGNL